MNSMRLSELLQIRVTPQMKTFFQNQAQRLGVRTCDIIRIALIDAVSSQRYLNTSTQEQETNESKHTIN